MLFDKSQLIQIIRDMAKIRSAEIYESDTLTPFTKQTFTIDLSVARSSDNPMSVGFAFKSFILKNATGNADNTANIFIKFNKNDSGISWVNYLNNDSETCIDGMWSDAFLYWPAQAGKSMTLVVSTNSDLRTGSLILGGSVVTRESQNTTISQSDSGTTVGQALVSWTVPAGTVFKGQISIYGPMGAGSIISGLLKSGSTVLAGISIENYATIGYSAAKTQQIELPAGSYTFENAQDFAAAGTVAVTGVCYDVE